MSYTTALQMLIDEVVYDKIIEYMADVDISRRVFPVEFRNSGDALKIVKEGAWPDAEEIAQGAEVPIFQPDYVEVTEIYKKIGYRTQITHEMITDERWDMIARAARKAGQQLGLKMSIDVLREAWGTAGVQTYTVSGRWGGANADEIGDIANCIGKLTNLNYGYDLMIVNPLDYAHLAAMDEFIHKDKGGDIKRYEVGSIMNLDVIVTPMMSENNFLMLDTEHAGRLFIREDLRRARYEEVTRDIEGQVFFIRYREATIAPSAIVFATGY
jgi:hypothetical protein